MEKFKIGDTVSISFHESHNGHTGIIKSISPRGVYDDYYKSTYIFYDYEVKLNDIDETITVNKFSINKIGK